ncbi:MULTISPECIES: hypothetical protein [Vibrio]|uniref:Uncharacterized protein n=1 Tax=Vibrio crassostreae TaxID=246167 RepID=A0ABM9QSG4_9VIBR|nr:hypothetical protein [Vibrio crassostreae]CAH6912306.1 conserved hypothetical protein [Vibrio chagasii]MDH5952037.1 hypothetical protein [Vibrio crassostreae]TCN98714.1 hypothetical protein EDB50_101494 [Vibrio crassostreae]TCT53059.1 hypothetical protein EDB39_101121 [Vibrio crassostreae]TCT63933.1 hypothetical protein EDB40_101430 [Vibrio crassostreae]
MQKSKVKTLEYPIIKEFRLNGRWVSPNEKTIHLLPQQTAFLIQNGKLGPAIEVKVSSKFTEKEGK